MLVLCRCDILDLVKCPVNHGHSSGNVTDAAPPRHRSGDAFQRPVVPVRLQPVEFPVPCVRTIAWAEIVTRYRVMHDGDRHCHPWRGGEDADGCEHLSGRVPRAGTHIVHPFAVIVDRNSADDRSVHPANRLRPRGCGGAAHECHHHDVAGELSGDRRAA